MVLVDVGRHFQRHDARHHEALGRIRDKLIFLEDDPAVGRKIRPAQGRAGRIFQRQRVLAQVKEQVQGARHAGRIESNIQIAGVVILRYQRHVGIARIALHFPAQRMQVNELFAIGTRIGLIQPDARKGLVIERNRIDQRRIRRIRHRLLQRRHFLSGVVGQRMRQHQRVILVPEYK